MMTTQALPTLHELALPDDRLRRRRRPSTTSTTPLRQARAQSPFALGPLRPGSSHLRSGAHGAARPRFTMPRGLALAVQGITSGPVWDRVCGLIISMDGAEHHRLRRLVSRAFTPRAAERLRAGLHRVITELVATHRDAGRCDIVTDIARPYPVPIICALLGAPARRLATVLGVGRSPGHAFGGEVAQHVAEMGRPGTSSMPT